MVRSKLAITRRGMLGAAAAALALPPWLERPARAGGTSAPRRLVLLSTPNGVVQGSFWPTASQGSLVLGPSHAALEPYKDHLVYVRGLRYPWSTIVAHKGGSGMMWTGCSMSGSSQTDAGYALGPSIDQILADDLSHGAPYRSLEFAVQQSQGWNGNIYLGSQQPIAAEPDPWAMFDRLFADFSLDDGELEALRARRRSVLDVIKGDLGRLEATLPSEERIKTQAHLDAVRAIEARLDDTLGAACTIPELGAQQSFMSNDNVPVMSRLQIDLLVQALACDLTRVASLAFGNDNCVHTWLGQDNTHHNYSHDEATYGEELRAINRFHGEELAYLVASLAAIPEDGGTMLDNTLVVYASEIADGHHGDAPVPVMLAGGAGLGLETGRLLEYDDVAYQGLLVSIAHLMGRTDIESVGDLDPGLGPLPGLA